MSPTVVFPRIAAFWNTLVEPVPSLQAPELRQKARLLASLLLVVILIHVIVLLPWGYTVFTQANVPLHVAAIILNCIFLSIAYLICRRGSVQTAGASVIIYGTVLLSVLAVVRETNNMGILSFFLIIMLFANLFFSARMGLIVSVVHIAIMLLLPFITPKIPLIPLFQGTLIFYFVSAVICTQYSYIRDHLEAGRRRQLIDTEARFRAAVEGSLDAFFLFESIRDTQGKIVDFRLTNTNSQSQKQLPAPREIMMGRPVSETIPELFSLGVFLKLVEVAESGKPYFEELSIPLPHGNAWFYYQVVRVGDGVAIFSRNISERKRAEEVLRQSENRYRLISESMSDYAYSISVASDGTREMEWLTDSFKRLTGFTREEIDARGLLDFYYPDDIARVLEAVEIAKRGEPTTGEYRIVTKSGDVRWVKISRFPEWDEQAGRTVRFYNVAQDITGRKQAEQSQRERERLRIALESERELNQIKNTLMVTISHEFRTPLATIQASSDLLQRYFERMSAEQRAQHMTLIQSQVGHLARMLDDISFAVQNASGLITLQLEDTDLVDVCRKLVDEMQNTPLNVHTLLLDHALPSVECMVDVKLFKRIVRNLLSNAVKFSPDGGEIRVEVLKDGDSAVVRVRDQGIGISPEEQQNLFQPFFQPSSTATNGTGMGLSTVKDCVMLHGGTISVESEPGEGSIFTVRLPAVRDVTEPPENEII